MTNGKQVYLAKVCSFLVEQGCAFVVPLFEKELTDRQCELCMNYSTENEDASLIKTGEKEIMLVVFSRESFKFAYLTSDEKLKDELNAELTFQWKVYLSK